MKITFFDYMSSANRIRNYSNATTLVLLLFCVNLIVSQTTNLAITESPEYKDEVKAISVISIHTSNDGLTGIVRESKKNILFDVFDKDLNKIFSKVVESHKKENYVGDVFFEDEIKVFTVFSPKKNERIIYCHIFNLENKSHKKVELFSTTVEKNGSLFSGNNKRQTSFAISPDGNYIAIATDNIKKNSNSYTIRVYNSNTLKEVYKKAYQEHKEKFFEPNDLVVDNAGTVFTVGKLFLKGKSQKKKGEANYQFILNKITKDTNQDLKIDLENDHVRSLIISNSDNKFHLMGFYSEKNVGRIKGGCSFVIDTEQLTVKEKKAYKLPLDVYEDLYGYRKADKKKKKELSNFYIDYVILDNNGNTYLLAEEFYVTSTYVSTGNGGYWTTTFHYNDVLILKFNTEGDLDWGRSIFKRATAPSYNAFLKDDKLHVILNSGKNLTEKKDGRTKASKGWFESSALYDFEYSEDGKVSYNKIQNNKGKTYYSPHYGTFKNNKFIMMSSGRKKRQFMMLE